MEEWDSQTVGFAYKFLNGCISKQLNSFREHIPVHYIMIM